jgi:hypothetical protein
MKICATFPAVDIAAAAGRTIAGTAVPYGVPGTISDGRTVIFEPGSLDAAGRPLLLRDHDRTRPLGKVIDAVDRGDRMDVTARVSRTVDGDEALILAADGVLPAFSVGAEPTDHYTDPDDVLHVVAADWPELSLLTFGAFDAARVAHVTAQKAETAMSDEPVPTEPDEPDPDDEKDPVDDVETAGAELVPITAGARHPSRRHVGAEVSLKTIGPLWAQACAGDRRAQDLLKATVNRYSVQAALNNVTMVGTDNVGGMQRPAYQPEIVEIVSHGAPMTEIIRQGDIQRGDFPNKVFLTWSKLPTVAIQSAEKTAINSTPVGLVPASVPIKTFATGNDISQQTIDFGPASFIEEYVRAASSSYADTIDTYAVTALLAAAVPVVTALADSFIVIVQKLMAALDPTKVPAGRLFVAVPWATAANLLGVTMQNGPAYWDMSVDLGNFIPDTSVAGLLTVVDPHMPANTYLLGLTTAATWYDTPGVPYTLQAVHTDLLGVDLAVFGYGALGVQYPGALVKTTPV